MTEWVARQLTEAYGWKAAARYLVRDRDTVYGDVFIRRLWGRWAFVTGQPRGVCPWQNGCAERPVGSIRRRCLDEARTNLSVRKDVPVSRCVQPLAVPSPSRFSEACIINTSGLISGKDKDIGITLK
jgi:hypothetical protein